MMGPDSDVSFQLGRALGSGTFGTVFEAMNSRTGEMVAIKRISLKSHKMQQQLAMARSEIELMRLLRHPNVVRIKGDFVDGSEYCIIMELVAGRSLADMVATIGRFHENVVRKFTRQLLLALQFAHAHRVIHRDVKGKNVLLTTTGEVRLCDFGSAKVREEHVLKDAVSGTYSYTPLWIAPEALNAKVYDEKVDIWALGCVIIEMASGADPWSEKQFTSPNQALFYIGTKDEIPRIPAHLSPTGQEFARLCLTRNPDLRPSAAQLLQHPFVNSELGCEASCASPTAADATGGQVEAAAEARQARAQLELMAQMVDSKVATMPVRAGLRENPNAAFVPNDEIPPPPPPEEDDSADFPPPPPPPPPYPFSHSDSPAAMPQSSLEAPVVAAAAAGAAGALSPSPSSAAPASGLSSAQFNVLYSFATDGLDGREVGASDNDGASSGGESRSVSRVFSYTPSVSSAGGGESSVDSTMSLTSSVLSFVDGYDSWNLNNNADTPAVQVRQHTV